MLYNVCILKVDLIDLILDFMLSTPLLFQIKSGNQMFSGIYK